VSPHPKLGCIEDILLKNTHKSLGDGEWLNLLYAVVKAYDSANIFTRLDASGREVIYR
jgi:hypothetical protein